MTVPQRPVMLVQMPVSGTGCIINGREFGWLNCTPTGVAMAVDKATMGRNRTSGCAIRRMTGDTSGGTTLGQCCGAATDEYGITIDVRTGPRVCTPAYAAGQAQHGHGFNLQGNSGVLVGTKFRSTGKGVNHNVYVNEVRGGVVGDPEEGLVYDPAANGRKAGWGTAALSPDWWPWWLIKSFAAALRPWGDDDPRKLGPGKFYAAIFPGTEPHVHLHFTGSKRTSPFPRAMTLHSTVRGHRVNVRSGPSTRYPIRSTPANGTTFRAYQVTAVGQLLAGSRTWYGDHNGTRWVHSSGIR